MKNKMFLTATAFACMLATSIGAQDRSILELKLSDYGAHLSISAYNKDKNGCVPDYPTPSLSLDFVCNPMRVVFVVKNCELRHYRHTKSNREAYGGQVQIMGQGRFEEHREKLTTRVHVNRMIHDNKKYVAGAYIDLNIIEDMILRSHGDFTALASVISDQNVLAFAGDFSFSHGFFFQELHKAKSHCELLKARK